MAAIFQTVLMRLALYGLAASLALMLLRSRIARDTFARLLSVWRSLNAFGRVAVCSFLLIGILIGGDKTNNVPPNMNSTQMMQGVISQTGLPFPVPHSPFPIANPVQSSFAERKAMNWNVRGAWKDSFWLPFEDGWVFPCGTNHLSGVEVVSCGQIWPTPFDTNAVVSAGLPFEIVRGLSTFGYEFTPFVFAPPTMMESTMHRASTTAVASGRRSACLPTPQRARRRNGIATSAATHATPASSS